MGLVAVLETVRDVRCPNTSKEESSQKRRGFGLLELHEPTQEFLNSPDNERPQQMKEDNNAYEAEVSGIIPSFTYQHHNTTIKMDSTSNAASKLFEFIRRKDNEGAQHLEQIWVKFR
ncbi:hypothetical protein FBEOM_9769 [Fusarium beomiforme]|uniref:Uncharacterized protein n=1 Tax=Fusarium beomiforme TaxID=44412 RepID=A0A9P5ACZ8_9HYPO|nr:hypothetical protein FBEOM_9769 [Fusarium beomiforme]